VVMV